MCVCLYPDLPSDALLVLIDLQISRESFAALFSFDALKTFETVFWIFSLPELETFSFLLDKDPTARINYQQTDRYSDDAAIYGIL